MNLLVTPKSIGAAWCVSAAGAEAPPYQARVSINAYGGHIAAGEARELALQLLRAARQAETFATQMADADPAQRVLFETPMGGLA